MAEYKALYRKWRPAVFSDVIGQEHITDVLKSEVMTKSVSHAYLFCGSRGTGKTTCAKILAKAVSCDNPQNGDPCGVCPSCLAARDSLDIYEIDAASHNGVDSIRELRDSVVYPPAELKRRVYIIDEVHMLSDGAFNALLKTLEEPPEHVLFILATTELRKIPATILSRCKRFDFRRIAPEKIAARLRTVSDEENIRITDGALLLIARLAAGAMRDALSMLELFCMSDVETDETRAAERLGVVGKSAVFSLLDAICERDGGRALGVIDDAYRASKNLGVLCEELADTLRDILVVKYTKTPEKLLDATASEVETLRAFSEKLSDARLLYLSDLCEDIQLRLSRAALSRRTVIETGVLKMCDERLSAPAAALAPRLSALEKRVDLLERKSTAEGFVPAAAAPASHRVSPAAAGGEPSPDAATAKPAVAPAPADGDVPFDGPYLSPAEASRQQPSPKGMTPRPLPRALRASAAAGEQGQEPSAPNGAPMSAYAEFVEEVEATSKMAASMLAGGRALLTENGACLIELANPIAPKLLSAPNEAACIAAALEKILGYAPQVRLSYVPADAAPPQRVDLSPLES